VNREIRARSGLPAPKARPGPKVRRERPETKVRPDLPVPKAKQGLLARQDPPARSGPKARREPPETKARPDLPAPMAKRGLLARQGPPAGSGLKARRERRVRRETRAILGRSSWRSGALIARRAAARTAARAMKSQSRHFANLICLRRPKGIGTSSAPERALPGVPPCSFALKNTSLGGPGAGLAFYPFNLHVAARRLPRQKLTGRQSFWARSAAAARRFSGFERAIAVASAELPTRGRPPPIWPNPDEGAGGELTA
jgi:hypothetical protein